MRPDPRSLRPRTKTKTSLNQYGEVWSQTVYWCRRDPKKFPLLSKPSRTFFFFCNVYGLSVSFVETDREPMDGGIPWRRTIRVSGGPTGSSGGVEGNEVFEIRGPPLSNLLPCPETQLVVLGP